MYTDMITCIKEPCKLLRSKSMGNMQTFLRFWLVWFLYVCQPAPLQVSYKSNNYRDPGYVCIGRLLRPHTAPCMRLHGDRQPSEAVYRKDGTRVLNSGSDNEVWSFGEEAYPILVKYLNRREELRDYVRGLMKEAHEKGTPLLRGMFYAFPDDEKCAVMQDQYMFGSRYLVAPVMEAGVRERTLYLPEGTWKDVETGKTYEGRQTITVPAPLDVIPVLEKVG